MESTPEHQLRFLVERCTKVYLDEIPLEHRVEFYNFTIGKETEPDSNGRHTIRYCYFKDYCDHIGLEYNEFLKNTHVLPPEFFGAKKLTKLKWTPEMLEDLRKFKSFF